MPGRKSLLLRLGCCRRLRRTAALTRGLFAGSTRQAGNAWAQRSDVPLAGLRTGMKLYLGAGTGIGPLSLGITHAPRGHTGLALFIDRP